MRLGVRSLVAASSLLFAPCLRASADVITNFTLTHGSDTIQFSLSNTTPYTDVPVFPATSEEFEYIVPVTVDGTVYSTLPPTYARVGFENVQGPGVGAQLFVSYQFPRTNVETPYVNYFETGDQVYTKVNGAPTFTPETIIFPESTLIDATHVYPNPKDPNGNPLGISITYGTGDELVITQTDTSVSAVPEPSTLGLVGTGIVGALGAVRRRFV